jgi:hypothetical protein
MEESSGWERIEGDFEKFWLIMEIPPPQYPSFPFVPLIPKQALKVVETSYRTPYCRLVLPSWCAMQVPPPTLDGWSTGYICAPPRSLPSSLPPPFVCTTSVRLSLQQRENGESMIGRRSGSKDWRRRSWWVSATQTTSLFPLIWC